LSARGGVRAPAGKIHVSSFFYLRPRARERGCSLGLHQHLVSERHGSRPWRVVSPRRARRTRRWRDVTPFVRRARRPRRTCVGAQRPRAWRCCAATEVVVAPCDGHGSGDQRVHGGDRRVRALRLVHVSPARKKAGSPCTCTDDRGGRRPRPGHAGPAVLISSARDRGHELGRVERGEWVRVCLAVATYVRATAINPHLL
jgi:hypothetical protein